MTLVTDQQAQTGQINNGYLCQVAEGELLAHLISVILERSTLLLNIPAYSKEIHRYTQTHTLSSAASFSPSPHSLHPLLLCRVFSCHLLKLCMLHPSLVVDQSHELLEFAGTTTNVYSKEEVYTHVVMKLWLTLAGGHSIPLTGK